MGVSDVYVWRSCSIGHLSIDRDKYHVAVVVVVVLVLVVVVVGFG